MQAVRSGDWKLHFPHEYRTLAGRPGGRDGFKAIEPAALEVREIAAYAAPRVEGAIEFRNVSFQYQVDGRPVLTDVSFTVPPGNRFRKGRK